MSVLPKRKSRKPILPPIPDIPTKELHINTGEKTICVFAGSFDPITWGHLDIINKVSAMFDEVYVIVAINTSKATLFSLDERMSLISAHSLPHNVKVCSSIPNMLTVEHCKLLNARFLVRGVRNIIDFEYELTISQLNYDLMPSVQTIFIPTTTKNSTISSSATKEISRFGGEVSKYVPRNVSIALKEKWLKES